MSTRAVGSYFARLRAAAGRPDTPLALLLPHVSPSLASEAKTLSASFNKQLRSPKSGNIVSASPEEVERALFLNVCGGRFIQARDIVRAVKNDPLRRRFQTKLIYLLFIYHLANLSDARDCLSLIAEVIQELTLDKEETEYLADQLFRSFRNCDDFTLLQSLHTVYRPMGVLHGSPVWDLKLSGSMLHVLINSEQYHKAFEMFENCARNYDHNDCINYLPIAKLLDAMCLLRDCDLLVEALQMAVPQGLELLHKLWTNYLSLGLQVNHAALVTFIYTTIIMRSATALLSEEVVLTNKVTEAEEANPVLASMSETTLSAILHTFATNGDVNNTLGLIEWHYIHKAMRGEKNLDKDLLAKIVQAYCYRNGDDQSFSRILDVIESFSGRLHEYSYKDFSESISHHLSLGWSDLHNPLFSLEELRLFSSKQLLHALLLSKSTIVIFINCMLNHLTKYQNFSSVVTFLSTVQQHTDVSEYLDSDLYDILFKSISSSAAARRCGLYLHSYLKELISRRNLEYLILSSLRGTQYNLLLESYVYDHLSLYGELRPSIVMRIVEHKNANESLQRLVEVISGDMGDLSKVWEENGFSRSHNIEVGETDNDILFDEIDRRDCDSLSRVLVIE